MTSWQAEEQSYNKLMRIDRFGAVDTSEAAEKKMIELLRAKTPQERLQMVFNWLDSMNSLVARNPQHQKAPKNESD
jgi:hypothetical protein